MSSVDQPRRGANVAIAGAGIVMVLCCAVGPAIIGAFAGGAIGGWLGIVCAAIVSAAVGVLAYRRRRRRGGC